MMFKLQQLVPGILVCVQHRLFCRLVWTRINQNKPSSDQETFTHTLSFLPAGVWSRFQVSLCVRLPHAVGELVADGRHHPDELQRPLVQVQRPDPGQVGAQVPVDARTLDADQSSEVQTRPVRVCSRITQVLAENIS